MGQSYFSSIFVQAHEEIVSAVATHGRHGRKIERLTCLNCEIWEAVNAGGVRERDLCIIDVEVIVVEELGLRRL